MINEPSHTVSCNEASYDEVVIMRKNVTANNKYRYN
jgi:hypothetical protein